MPIDKKIEEFEEDGLKFVITIYWDYEEGSILSDKYEDAGFLTDTQGYSHNWRGIDLYDYDKAIDLDDVEENDRFTFAPAEAILAVRDYNQTLGMSRQEAWKAAFLWARHQFNPDIERRPEHVRRYQIMLEGDTNYWFPLRGFYENREYYRYYIPSTSGTVQDLHAELDKYYTQKWHDDFECRPHAGWIWMQALKTYFSLMALTIGWYLEKWQYVYWALELEIDGVKVHKDMCGGFESHCMSYMHEQVQYHVDYIKAHPATYVLDLYTETKKRLEEYEVRKARLAAWLDKRLGK